MNDDVDILNEFKGDLDAIVSESSLQEDFIDSTGQRMAFERYKSGRKIEGAGR